MAEVPEEKLALAIVLAEVPEEKMALAIVMVEPVVVVVYTAVMEAGVPAGKTAIAKVEVAAALKIAIAKVLEEKTALVAVGGGMAIAMVVMVGALTVVVEAQARRRDKMEGRQVVSTDWVAL